MANIKVDHDFLYDPFVVAERLADLRKGDGIDYPTLKQLSDEIHSKTGVSISGTQLGKYESKSERMNINNLLALADYYGVSLDYLVGRSESKSSDSTDKHASQKFGLSDKAMELLKTINYGYPILESEGKELVYIGNKVVSSKLISFIFENDNFWTAFDGLLSSYVQAKQENEIVHPSEINSADAARYSLIRLFENLIDDVYAWLDESKPKSKPPFKISEKKSKTTKK